VCARSAEAGQRRGNLTPPQLRRPHAPGSPLRCPPTAPRGTLPGARRGAGGEDAAGTAAAVDACGGPGASGSRREGEAGPAGAQCRAAQRSAGGGGGGEALGEPRGARGTRPEPGREPRHRAAAAAVTAERAMSFSEMNRRTLAFRGGGLVTGGGGPTKNNAGGEASSWPPQPQPRLPAPPAPQQPNTFSTLGTVQTSAFAFCLLN
jgi:zinc finger/BTB domain-containing protein 10